MSTKFLSPGWRMPRNANQSKQSNYSLHQPDQADYIETDYSINGLTQITVSCWIKTTTNNSDEHVWSFPKAGTGSGLALQTGANAGNPPTSLGFKCNNYAMPSVVTVQDTSFDYKDGNWHNVIISSSDTKFNMYIDGVLKASTSITGAAMSGARGDFYIGSFGSTSHPQWNVLNMSFSDVCIFDYALSDGGVSVGSTATGQIAQLYGNGSSLPNPMALPSPPIAYYPLGTSAWNGNFLAENNAIGDYVFKMDSGAGANISSNINQSNTGGKFTVSIWVKNATRQFSFDHGAATTGGFTQFSNKPIVYLASNYWQYFVAQSTSNDWQHWVVFVDTTNVTNSKLWINKVSISQSNANTNGSADSFTSGFKLFQYSSGSSYGKVSNMMYFTNYEIDQANVDKLYNYGSPLMSTTTLTQAPNAWYKLDASEIYNNSNTEWSIDNNANSSAYLSSLNFDRAASNNISLGSSSSIRPTGDYTISIWYNLNSTVNAGIWCAGSNINNSGLTLFSSLQYAGGLALYHKGSSGTSAQVNLGSGSVVINSWHNAIFTYDDTSRVIKGYLNGDLISTVSVAGTGSVSWANNFYLGRLIQSGSYYLDGQLSNFQIFNTKLEETGSNSVETLYNSGNPLTDMSSFSSLVSWWKLDNTITGIEDSKGSNNGTNNGATEYVGFVNTLAGDSTGMSQLNLVQSDLQTVAPYSKYAMKLDDATLSDYINVPNNSTLQITGNLTLSSWVRIDGSYISNGHLIAKADSYVLKSHQSTESNKPRFQVNDGSFHNLEGLAALSLDTWHHIAGVREGNSLKLYVNGDLVASSTPTIGNLSVNTNPVQFNAYTSAYSSDLSLSNNAIWNVALNASEIREIYNEGLPSNLNTFSGTAPISWWQLGENSSFDGSNWKYADEMTAGNDADSVNTAETALTNGVGTTANGTSTGMAVGALVGDAPYSTANAISSGMAVTAKGTDVPS